MSKSTEQPKKKPAGGRPIPRRLFSFDSIRREKSGSESDTTQNVQSSSGARLAEHPIPEVQDDIFSDANAWTDKPIVTSPDPNDNSTTFPTAFSSKEGRVKRSTKPTALSIDKSKSTKSSLDSSFVPPPSPSKRRWETIRTHVLPSISSDHEILPPGSPFPESAAPSARPSTPKLRFGRGGFRRVAETVQTQQVPEHRRFTEMIRQACWLARFGELPSGTKGERDVPQSTMGSTLHLPFMSSTSSLQSPGINTLATQFANKSNAFRRPQSSHSLVPTNKPSVSHITRAFNALPPNLPQFLPHEDLILSTLLLPFLAPSGYSPITIEQATAVEAFEFLVRTWGAPSNEAELQRCIWCCKAASIASNSRARLLGTLSAALFSRERPFSADTPAILQTLLQALYRLKYTLVSTSESKTEIASLSGCITAIQSGKCGELSIPSIEREFGVRFSKEDNEVTIREAVVTECMVRCLEVGADKSRPVMLQQLQEYWPLPEPNVIFTPLLVCIHWRKLKTFVSSVLSMLASTFAEVDEESRIIVLLFRTRIIPEITAMRDEDAVEIQNEVIRLVLELLSVKNNTEREYVLMHFCDWYQHKKDWKASIEAALQRMIHEAEWIDILRVIPTVMNELDTEVQAPLVSFILPLLNERLVSDPPEAPCPQLTQFLNAVSRAYPKAFFKPLFSCAAATKDATAVTQLCTLGAITKFVPDFWTRDVEMVTVALMNDMSKTKLSDGKIAWGKARIGQLTLLLELISYVRNVHQSKDITAVATTTKFALMLESRLGVVIEAKEKNILIPPSHRILLSLLLRDIRLLTHSLRPAPWLVSVISWVLQWDDTNLYPREDESQEDHHEAIATLNKLQAVYIQAQDASRSSKQQRRATILNMSALEGRKPSITGDGATVSEEEFASRVGLLGTISKSLRATVLELLVSVCGLLTPANYAKFGSLLWSRYMDSTRAIMIGPTCFLVMQYAEKMPEEFTRMVELELSSSEPTIRRRALQRISTLASWRFQILSHEVVLDRNHRRPFKLQRPQILFVATDIGSSLFIYEDDTDDYRDSNGHAIPLELRRRLSEIGWAQEARLVDRRVQRIRTPLSLLPTQYLQRLDLDSEEPSQGSEVRSPVPSPEPSPTKDSSGDISLVRRGSSPGGRTQGGRRRPIFVSTLVSLFPKLALLTEDSDFIVASAAQDLITDFMRDDPTLLARSVFYILSEDSNSINLAISTLRAFLHIRNSLPAAMAHHILNHLTGFLKSIRDTERAEPLKAYAYCLPTIAKLTGQVSKLTMREIRRAKVDPYLFPTGALWFPPSAPTGPLFPRGLTPNTNPFEAVPSTLTWITIIRTSQNMLFLGMLKKNAQDVGFIRKNITRLQLPSTVSKGEPPILTPMDMIPRRTEPQWKSYSVKNATLTALSLTLARSYLLLVRQIFVCISRHLNDRDELAVMLDGLNRILLAHGDDIGIVSHTMLALMTASTRFRRLFISGGGYTLFMPAVIKAYVEAEHNPCIRRTIEYAASRFYALHQESFMFQSFDAMAQILSFPDVDGSWVCGGIYALFSTLRGHIPPGTDVSGIHNLNKEQEQEALMVTMAEQVPQAFVSSITRTASGGSFAVPIPEEYEMKRLRLDDVVKLFLTVIAYNPGVQRAERFLRFLRLLTPYLYPVARSVQTVLRDGIEALGGILLSKSSSRAKVPESSQLRPNPDLSYEVIAEEKIHEGKSGAPSDLLFMRIEYLRLVNAYTTVGGHVSNVTTQRVVELVKAITRDTRANNELVSQLLSDYVRTLLIRQSHPSSVKDAISLLSSIKPLISSHFTNIDFTGVFEVVVQLSENAIYTSDRSFCQETLFQYCQTGLDISDMLSSKHSFDSLPLRGTVVRLLANSVSFLGTEVTSELEKHAPSHHFLMSTVLPFTLTLKTTFEIVADSTWADGWRRDIYSRVWLRLLSYILKSFQKEPGASVKNQKSSQPAKLERRKSVDNRSSRFSGLPSNHQVLAFSAALQVLKVIIIRAQDDLSNGFPGVWERLADTLKALLADGDALFALKPTSFSEPPSPALSPRTSTFSERQPMPSMPTFSSSASITHGRRLLSPPRLIDYLTWSFIQWLFLSSSPLMLQMRIFTQERIATLASELRNQGNTSFVSMPSRGSRVSTLFSKPRRSIIGHSLNSSAASTPRNSTLINTSLSLPALSDFRTPTKLSSSHSFPAREAGYARTMSPVSPTGRTSQDSGPKIVHLGPVNPYSALGPAGLPRPVSPGGTKGASRNIREMAKEVIVYAPGLVRMTYRRIRLVQRLLGYTDLLPLSGSEYIEDDNLDEGIRVWSRRQALEAVVSEIRELMEELSEGPDFDDDNIMVLDSQEFFTQESVGSN